VATYPALFEASSERWRLTGVTINGGVTVGGIAPRGLTDGGGLWVCEQIIPLPDPEHRKAARALEVQMDGGARSTVVPRFIGDDGPGGEWLIDIVFAEPAALRATTATVSLNVSLPLIGGEAFSITHPTKGKRLYVVASAEDPVSGEQEITFRPPLREAVTTEALDFQDVGCVMQLANPADFIGAMDVTKLTEANAVWVESFDAL
jgi:hypothetical protein